MALRQGQEALDSAPGGALRRSDPRVIELYEDGSTIVSVLGDLGKNRDFGDLATRAAPRAPW